jgi:hypothetical protein
MRPVQPSVVAVQRHVMLYAVPSSGIVNKMIRITGIGDRDRSERLIRISGIRNRRSDQCQNGAPECLTIPAVARATTLARNQRRCAIGTEGLTQPENLAPAHTINAAAASTVIRPSARSIMIRSRVSS